MLTVEDKIENITAMIKTVDYMESQIHKINPDGGAADKFVKTTKEAIDNLRAIIDEANK